MKGRLPLQIGPFVAGFAGFRTDKRRPCPVFELTHKVFGLFVYDFLSQGDSGAMTTPRAIKKPDL